MQITKDLQCAIDTAKNAGKIVKNAFGQEQQEKKKGGKNGIVTEVDVQVEQFIIESLQKHSEYSILSEETGKQEGSQEAQWIIDPIDGTTNFIRNIPLCAISIGLLTPEGFTLGVVYNPITDECYYAEREAGAYRNDHPIAVSTNSDPDRTVVLMDWGYAVESQQTTTKIREALSENHFLRTLGVTALELCWVAAGMADSCVVVGDQIWDYAAGVAIAREAGAVVTDVKDQEVKNESATVIASSPAMHQRILEQLTDIT